MLVYSENRPRGLWKLTRVEEIIIGHDGTTRAAIVRIERAKTRRLPIQRLYPIKTGPGVSEVGNSVEAEVSEVENSVEAETNNTVEETTDPDGSLLSKQATES